MANPNKAKGSLAERAVRDFINVHYPMSSQGFGATIIPSRGSHDIGDIDGVPFTTIEVKNYSKPVWGNLVSNAEWKAANARRDFWVLVSKQKGFGAGRAGLWNAVCTIAGMGNFGFVDDDGMCLLGWAKSLDKDPAQRSFTLGGFSHKFLQLYCDYRVVFKFFPCYSGIGEIAQKELNVGNTDYDLIFCVFPRKSKEVQDYYVFTNLDSFVRLLEAVGVVPPIEASPE